MSVSLESSSNSNPNSLTQQEMRVVTTYTGQSSLNGITRSAKYFKELSDKDKTKTVLYIAYRSLATIGKYTALGAGIGGAVGAVAGTIIEPGAGTLAGGTLGLQVGAGIGAAVGVRMATKKIKIELQESQRYKNWKKRAIEERVFPIFNKILHDSAFQNYMCPIEDQLTRIPILTPCCTSKSGLRFEKKAIENWIVTYGNEHCPLCREPLTLEDLVYDSDRVATIVRAAREQMALLNTSQAEYASQLREGLVAIVENGIEDNSQVFKEKAKVEATEAFSLNMPEDEFIKLQLKNFRDNKAALGIPLKIVST
jgi:hypothetical protein